jgi:hypothetical protein
VTYGTDHDAPRPDAANDDGNVFPFERHPPAFAKEPTGFIMCGDYAMPYWLPIGAEPVAVVEVAP